ncbi:MAG TPA: rhomboid family intramembrane serine protease, partial [Telluria sp.]|nr:rhomboid family intramembrane serine protease [Telluria sp.]
MAGQAVFDVRFDLNGRQRGENPFKFHGDATLAIEPDFIIMRGRGRRVFRPEPEQEQRLRMVDIVNVRSDGDLLSFDVLGVKDDVTITFEVPDHAAHDQIVTLLPRRQTEAFAVAEADRELFHDRIDHWTPSTPVIWTLLALNIGIYALMWLDRSGGGSTVGESIKLVRWGSNAGPLTLGGQWWRLVSSMFLHGSLLHIAFNMFALYQVGRLVERMFGSLRFAALYMLAGVAGSLASVLWNPN